MPYDKETLKHTILPEVSLPSMTKNIRPHNFGFMARRKSFLHSHGCFLFAVYQQRYRA